MRFLCRGDSDVYRIVTDMGFLYLKIRRPPVSAAQCAGEARLIMDLVAANVPVVRPVPLKGGGYVEEVEASEGLRPVMLFEAAPVAEANLSDLDQVRQLGSVLARMHDVADSRLLDPDLPEARPDAVHGWVREIESAVELSNTQFATLNEAARRITEAYSALARSAPDYGPIHGDLARCNIRRDDDGRITLFDFGAAQNGWRVSELLNVWRATLPRLTPQTHAELWGAFPPRLHLTPRSANLFGTNEARQSIGPQAGEDGVHLRASHAAPGHRANRRAQDRSAD